MENVSCSDILRCHSPRCLNQIRKELVWKVMEQGKWRLNFKRSRAGKIYTVEDKYPSCFQTEHTIGEKESNNRSRKTWNRPDALEVLRKRNRGVLNISKFVCKDLGFSVPR